MSTILVIDDDPDIRALIQSILIAAGHVVLMPPDLQTTREYLRACPERLLILLNLGKGGAKILFALADEPGLLMRHQVTVCTALYDRYMSLIAREFDLPVLQKPFDIADLEALVAQFEQTSF